MQLTDLSFRVSYLLMSHPGRVFSAHLSVERAPAIQAEARVPLWIASGWGMNE